MADMEMKPCKPPITPGQSPATARRIPANPTSSAQGWPRWLLWGEDDDGGLLGRRCLVLFSSNFSPVAACNLLSFVAVPLVEDAKGLGGTWCQILQMTMSRCANLMPTPCIVRARSAKSEFVFLVPVDGLGRIIRQIRFFSGSGPVGWPDCWADYQKSNCIKISQMKSTPDNEIGPVNSVLRNTSYCD